MAPGYVRRQLTVDLAGEMWSVSLSATIELWNIVTYNADSHCCVCCWVWLEMLKCFSSYYCHIHISLRSPFLAPRLAVVSPFHCHSRSDIIIMSVTCQLAAPAPYSVWPSHQSPASPRIISPGLKKWIKSNFKAYSCSANQVNSHFPILSWHIKNFTGDEWRSN